MEKSLPFEVHSRHMIGKMGVLCGHGFHLLRVSDGSQIGEGRSTQVDSVIFWQDQEAVEHSCRKVNCTFSTKKVEGKRLDVGGVGRLISWFDREHLIWQDEDGKLRCARLANEDSQRLLEDRVWSWVGKCLVAAFFNPQTVCFGKVHLIHMVGIV